MSVDSIPGYQEGVNPIGMEFADQHGRSIVIAWSEQQGGGQSDEPTIDDCPSPEQPQEGPPQYHYDAPTCDANGVLDVSGGTGYSWVLNADGSGTRRLRPTTTSLVDAPKSDRPVPDRTVEPVEAHLRDTTDPEEGVRL